MLLLAFGNFLLRCFDQDMKCMISSPNIWHGFMGLLESIIEIMFIEGAISYLNIWS